MADERTGQEGAAKQESSSLVAPSLRPTGIPARPFVVAMVPALLLAFEMCGIAAGDGRMGEPLLVFFATWLVVSAVFFAAAVVPTLLRALRSSLSLDEGGARFHVGGHADYIPFALLGDAEVRTSGGVSGAGELVLHATNGPAFARIPLFGARTIAAAQTLAATIAERRRAAQTTVPVSTLLARGDRDLDVWRADIAAAVERSRGDAMAYRTEALDFDALDRRLHDRGAPPAERAAAAYALLAEGSHERRTRVRLAIDDDAPPLLTAMVRVAPGGSDLVPEERLEDALSYLEELDREAVRRAVR